jgi:xanthosine utilization system XapX-like protein
MENIALIGIDLGKTLSIFIVRIIAGRPFTVKNSPDQS